MEEGGRNQKKEGKEREREKKKKNITKTGPQLFANEVNAFSIHNSLSHWVEENATSFKTCVSVCVCVYIVTSPVKWGQRSSFLFRLFLFFTFSPSLSSSPDALPSAFVASLCFLFFFVFLFFDYSTPLHHQGFKHVAKQKHITPFFFFFPPDAYWDTHRWDIIDEYGQRE